jgi:isoquinoline 1-oxidoreductase beta subunit
MSAVAGKIGRVSRRDFLKAGAAGSASLVIAFYWGDPWQASAAADAGKNFEPNAFIEIHPNGEIRLIAARSEMGQGVRTSMTMILAEELDADWSKIKVEQAVATSEMKYGDMTTGGSESVRSSWDPLRHAGATARDMLITAAAQTWGVPVSECSAIGGSVIERKKSSRRLGYGALVEKAAALPVPKDVPLKDAKDYRIVGTSKPRVDGGPIVIGEAHYGIDTKVPGMLYAVVARPPVFGGRVKKFEAEKAQAVPDVKKVVEVPVVEMPPLFGEERPAKSGHQHYLWGGVAVVADST